MSGDGAPPIALFLHRFLCKNNFLCLLRAESKRKQHCFANSSASVGADLKRMWLDEVRFCVCVATLSLCMADSKKSKSEKKTRI
jgi:hypothetical protein